MRLNGKVNHSPDSPAMKRVHCNIFHNFTDDKERGQDDVRVEAKCVYAAAVCVTKPAAMATGAATTKTFYSHINFTLSPPSSITMNVPKIFIRRIRLIDNMFYGPGMPAR